MFLTDSGTVASISNFSVKVAVALRECFHGIYIRGAVPSYSSAEMFG